MSEEMFYQLIKDLETASKEIIDAQLVVHDLANKYASLCINILVEGRRIPELINRRIEKRKAETGLDPVHPDFWDADMINALSEHFENNKEVDNVRSPQKS